MCMSVYVCVCVRPHSILSPMVNSHSYLRVVVIKDFTTKFISELSRRFGVTGARCSIQFTAPPVDPVGADSPVETRWHKYAYPPLLRLRSKYYQSLEDKDSPRMNVWLGKWERGEVNESDPWYCDLMDRLERLVGSFLAEVGSRDGWWCEAVCLSCLRKTVWVRSTGHRVLLEDYRHLGVHSPPHYHCGEIVQLRAEHASNHIATDVLRRAAEAAQKDMYVCTSPCRKCPVCVRYPPVHQT